MWNKRTADLVFQFLFRLHTPLLTSFCNFSQNGGEINIPPSPLVLPLQQLKIICQKEDFPLCATKLQTLKFTPYKQQHIAINGNNSYVIASRSAASDQKLWTPLVLPKDTCKKNVTHEHPIIFWILGNTGRPSYQMLIKHQLLIAAKPHLKR